MTQGHLRPSRAAVQHEEAAGPPGRGNAARHPAGRAAAAARRAHSGRRCPAAAGRYQPGCCPHRRAVVRPPSASSRAGRRSLGRRCRCSRRRCRRRSRRPTATALRRLTDAMPPMPAEAARRVVMSDLGAAFGPGWQERLADFDDMPLSRRPRSARCTALDGATTDGRIVEVAVKVQYPGVGQALRSGHAAGPAAGAGDRPAHPAERVRAGRRARHAGSWRSWITCARAVSRRAGRGRVHQPRPAATRRGPRRGRARAAGGPDERSPSRPSTPRHHGCSSPSWLDGVSLSTLLDGRMDLLPAGWRELSPRRRSGPGRPAARSRHLRARRVHRLDAR